MVSDEQRRPNWYLDPLVARQKRAVHLEWIRSNLPLASIPVLLKTDSFEEAHGDDELLFSLPFRTQLAIGIDINHATVRLCAARHRGAAMLTADVRNLPFANESIEVVISNSTLDHFKHTTGIEESIREVARVLKPGGYLFITLDNPCNPLYWILRVGLRWSKLPFQLGHTVSLGALKRLLEKSGLVVTSSDWLIHNPRIVSTLLFLVIRRLSGSTADATIAALLRQFAWLGRLPTRSYTACFIAASARKQGLKVPTLSNAMGAAGERGILECDL